MWRRGAGDWTRAGALPGAPEAFTVADDGTFLAATADGVHRSDDRGGTWTCIARSAH